MKALSSTKMLNPRQCATVLKALGDENRLSILESLLIGENCVTDLVRELKCSQPHAPIISVFCEPRVWSRGIGTANRFATESLPRSNEPWQTGKDRLWI